MTSTASTASNDSMASMLSMLIADDETTEQKALRLLVERNFQDIHVVAIARNGIELVAMAQEHEPDMAIVDISMPGMSGLEAIELLRHMHVKTRFIINTAYGEFEFAKKAIGLKVDDYILKPQRQELTIDTIRKLRDAIYEEKASQESQRQVIEVIKRIEPVLENEIMFSIFLNAPAEDSFIQYCDMRASRFNVGAVVSLLTLLSDGPRLFQIDASLVRESLNRSLHSRCSYIASVNASSLCLLVFQEGSVLGDWEAWLSDLLTVALDSLRKDTGLVLKAGVGGAYRQFTEMPKSYHESLVALQDSAQGSIRFYREGSAPAMAQASGSSPTSPSSAPTELSSAAQQALALPLELAFENGADNAVPAGLTDNLYVLSAMRRIASMYGEPLSLESVAAEIGVSTYYLSRLFKQELGLTFVEYLTGVRMKSAYALAKGTRMPVNEIAAKVGYGNVAYFIRVFKKYIGMTIGDLRKDALLKKNS